MSRMAKFPKDHSKKGRKKGDDLQGTSKKPIEASQLNKKKTITYRYKLRMGNLNPLKSVGTRLFYIFFVSSMIFVLLLGGISYQKAKSIVQDNAKESNLQTVIQTSEKLDIIFNSLQESLQQIFFDKELQANLTRLSEPNLTKYDQFTVIKDISTKMGTLTSTISGSRALYIISLDQSYDPITAGVPDTGLVADIQSKPWYSELTKSPSAVWEAVPNGDNGVFRYIHSFRMQTGSGMYIAAMDIKLSNLNSQLQHVSLGRGSKIELIDDNGVIVAANVDLSQEKLEPVTSVIKSSEETASMTTKDQNGKSVLAVYNKLEISGWKLAGIVPVSNLILDAKSILTTTFITAAVVAVIAILLGFWMVRMIARPLGTMSKLMQEGAGGNLLVRMQHKSHDEIGQLSASFNSMMNQITELVGHANNSASEVLGTASELAEASRKTALSAKEIAIATEEIANGAGSLSNEAERGSDLTEHIGTQVSAVITSNQEMQASAREVEQSSELGTNYLKELMNKTSLTGQMTRSLAERVNSLHQSSASVMKVLDVMQSITQQTNILSLNATIEASRAGAAGKGFMVVADEIRQLADQSKKSIAIVGQIAHQIQHEMNETIAALEEVNPLFEQQIHSVNETNEIFVSVQDQMNRFIQKLDIVTESIAGLSQSQEILSEAMTNVSAVAEESSATSEEVASLSSEQQTVGDQLVQLSGKLEKVSDQLRESLSKFKI